MKTYLVKFDTLVEGNYFYAGQEVHLLPSVAEKYIGAGLIEDPNSAPVDEPQAAEEPVKELEAPVAAAEEPAAAAEELGAKTEETKAEG